MQTVTQVLHTWDRESDETPLFQPFIPDDLIVHEFLTPPMEDSQCFHAHVIWCIEEISDTGKACTKFLVYISDNEPDELMGYHKLLEIVEEQYQ